MKRRDKLLQQTPSDVHFLSTSRLVRPAYNKNTIPAAIAASGKSPLSASLTGYSTHARTICKDYLKVPYDPVKPPSRNCSWHDADYAADAIKHGSKHAIPARGGYAGPLPHFLPSPSYIGRGATGNQMSPRISPRRWGPCPAAPPASPGSSGTGPRCSPRPYTIRSAARQSHSRDCPRQGADRELLR